MINFLLDYEKLFMKNLFPIELPYEIQCKILYEFCGLCNPTATIIKKEKVKVESLIEDIQFICSIFKNYEQYVIMMNKQIKSGKLYRKNIIKLQLMCCC